MEAVISEIKKIDTDDGGITLKVLGKNEVGADFTCDVWLEFDGRDVEIDNETGSLPDDVLNLVFDHPDTSRIYNHNYPSKT